MDGISTRHVRAIVYARRLLGWGRRRLAWLAAL
jgi:hypothetical protein